MDARTFLDDLVSYGREKDTDFNLTPTRIGTVDLGYSSGSGRPRVSFDGSAALSVNGFAYLGSYTPAAGDRVLLLAAGNTYVIAGKII